MVWAGLAAALPNPSFLAAVADTQVIATKDGAVHSSRLLAFAFAACLSSSCTRYPRPDIEILDGAKVPAPGFSFDGPEAPRIITFERLQDPTAPGGTRVTWHLLRRSGTTVAAPLRLTYGVVPDGYRAMQAADSLTAGTYRIYAKLTHAGDDLHFTVTPDGRVHEGRAAR